MSCGLVINLVKQRPANREDIADSGIIVHYLKSTYRFPKDFIFGLTYFGEEKWETAVFQPHLRTQYESRFDLKN